MTKPGNSGSEEPTQAEAPESTEEAQSVAATDPKAVAQPKPVAEPKPAVEAKPAEAKSAKASRAKADLDPEPLMAELEKAPPAPREQELRAKAVRRLNEPAPRTLRFSFYFFTASGLVWLVSMIASLVFKQEIIDAQVETNRNPDITPEQIANAVNQILWIVLIASLAFTVFLGLFGYKATEGTRRARTLVTIFSIMLVLFHLLLNGTQLGILSALLSVIGLALLWSPSARAYFPPRQLP